MDSLIILRATSIFCICSVIEIGHLRLLLSHVFVFSIQRYVIFTVI